MKTPEGYEKDAIRKYLKSIDAYVFSPTQTGFGQQTVDLLCCIDGTFWGIEVKREGKVPTPRQMLHISDIRKAGGKIAWGTAPKVCAAIESWRRCRNEANTLGL